MNYDLIYKYDVFYIVEHFLRGERIQTPVGIKPCLAMNIVRLLFIADVPLFQICGCSFAGAIVWDHIQVARGVRRIPTLYVIRYKGFHISFVSDLP